jgi:hypothetical protein
VAAELVPRFDRDAPAQTVRSAAVADVVRIDRRRALVTVAATVATSQGLDVRRLAVPVMRDQRGGLVVDDLPSIAPAPGRAVVPVSDVEPLMGPDRAAIENVVGRFLRGYLAGDSGGLSYLVAPGARIAAAGGRLELLSLTSLATEGPAGRGGRVVLATVHARDLGSRGC